MRQEPRITKEKYLFPYLMTSYSSQLTVIKFFLRRSIPCRAYAALSSSILDYIQLDTHSVGLVWKSDQSGAEDVNYTTQSK